MIIFANFLTLLQRGDILLQVNGESLVGRSHLEAVQIMKQCSKHSTVELSVLHVLPDISNYMPAFTPTWKYWITLPK